MNRIMRLISVVGLIATIGCQGMEMPEDVLKESKQRGRSLVWIQTLNTKEIMSRQLAEESPFLRERIEMGEGSEDKPIELLEMNSYQFHLFKDLLSKVRIQGELIAFIENLKLEEIEFLRGQLKRLGLDEIAWRFDLGLQILGRLEQLASVAQIKKQEMVGAAVFAISIREALRRGDLETASSLLDTKLRSNIPIPLTEISGELGKNNRLAELAKIAQKKGHNFTFRFLAKNFLNPKNRLIVKNVDAGRLHIKWNEQLANGELKNYEQILDSGESLYIGPVGRIMSLIFYRYGAGMQWLSTSQELRPKLDSAQIESNPRQDIEIPITSGWSGLWADNAKFQPAPAQAGMTTGEFTGNLLDIFPHVKHRLLEMLRTDGNKKYSPLYLSRLTSAQVEALLAEEIAVGALQLRAFLALPNDASDEVLKNVYEREMEKWIEFGKAHPEHKAMVVKIIGYLDATKRYLDAARRRAK